MKQIILIASLAIGLISCSNDKQDQQELKRQVNLAVIELNSFAAAYSLFIQDYGINKIEISYLYDYMWYHKFINYGSLVDADESPSAKYSDLSQAHHYWEFKIIQTNSVLVGFECMSRENMACGVGHIINYEFKTGEYSGYRIDLIHPELIPLLLGYFIDPTFTLIPGEEWDPNDYAKRMSATRQVNWGGTILPLLNNAIKIYGRDFGVDPASVEDLLL